MKINLSPREVAALAEIPEVLSSLADWHDREGTMAEAAGYSHPAKCHFLRRDVLRKAATVKLAEIEAG